MRSILGAHRGGGTGPVTAGRFLDHPRAHELLCWSRAGKLVNGSTIAAIRDHYDEKLMGLGFRKPARRTVDFPPGNPYYDVLYASRHAMGTDLWNRTNPAPEPPATLF